MPPKAVDNQTGAVIPAWGEWPAEPQEALPVTKERVWIDGCFDFTHHGHAGAMLQAKSLGKTLVVGVHSDEEILKNKGPPVMTLEERVAAVKACRWADSSVPNAPYVTSIPWIDHYGCQYVVHGDDITSDSNGEDCYRFVKEADRFWIVRRTPGISTTDLVGRMLLCTKSHFLKSVRALIRVQGDPDSLQRIRDYSSDHTGKEPHVDVFTYDMDSEDPEDHMSAEERATSRYAFERIVTGKKPIPGQRIVYVDGAFDLFSTGHIEFLRQVAVAEHQHARRTGWYESIAIKEIDSQLGHLFEPMYLVVGIHDDEVVNHVKGSNYPIMNVLERGLCVLPCKHVHAVVFGAPFVPTESYLQSLPCGRPHAVYHGPNNFLQSELDPYADARKLGLYHDIPPHPHSVINANEIVNRVLKNRLAFEKRQAAKGAKATAEAALQSREQQEKEAATANSITSS